MTLREFLSNLANAFRTYLDTTDKINAQNFADKVGEVFEKGKAQGGGGSDIADYLTIGDNQWANASFPEGYDFVLRMNKVPRTLNNLLINATGIKTATLVCEIEGAIAWTGVVRCSTVEVLDLTKFKPTPSEIRYFALGDTSLVSVLGEIDMTNCTKTDLAFNQTTALEEIRFKEGTISIALDFHWSTKLSAESYDSIMQGLSSTATGQTLTLTKYATVKATYDAKYGEGAWDILAASKTNWTIAYS